MDIPRKTAFEAMFGIHRLGKHTSTAQKVLSAYMMDGSLQVCEAALNTLPGGLLSKYDWKYGLRSLGMRDSSRLNKKAIIVPFGCFERIPGAS
jgi:hypothetical protein